MVTDKLSHARGLRRWFKSVLGVAGALVISLAATLSAPALAQTAPFASLIPNAKEVGSGLFRWWGFRVYEASLWSPNGKYQPGEPFALSLTYARSLEGKDIVDASLDQMRKLGLPVDRHPEWGPALSKVIVSVQSGDTLTGVYQPGEGAVFFFNDRKTGEIDDRLAKAFFAIWLDPKTSAPELRQSLLGQSP